MERHLNQLETIPDEVTGKPFHTPHVGKEAAAHVSASVKAIPHVVTLPHVHRCLPVGLAGLALLVLIFLTYFVDVRTSEAAGAVAATGARAIASRPDTVGPTMVTVPVVILIVPRE